MFGSLFFFFVFENENGAGGYLRSKMWTLLWGLWVEMVLKFQKCRFDVIMCIVGDARV